MIDYEHIKCGCGGIFGMYDREHFSCNRCDKLWPLYDLKYDRLMINDVTGWIFPVRDKEWRRLND